MTKYIIIHVLHMCLLNMNKGKTRKRCGTCSGCKASDCGVCKYCRDKPKYGGPGRLKQCCEKRKCIGKRVVQEQSKLLHIQENIMILVYAKILYI